MLATMIPISGDPFYIEINRITPEIHFRESMPFDPKGCGDYAVPFGRFPIGRHLQTFRLIAKRTYVYWEQL